MLELDVRELLGWILVRSVAMVIADAPDCLLDEFLVVLIRPLIPRLCCVLFVLALPSAGLCLSEEEQRRAHALIVEANEHWASSRWDKALAAYSRAYDLSSSPDVLYRVAQAHEKLGNYKEARRGYTAYLELAPGSRYRERIEAHIDELAELERKSQPTIILSTRPAGAAVELDGRLLDERTPVEIPVGIGAHALRISLQGHEPALTTIDISAGERIEKTIELVPRELVEEPEPEPEPVTEPEPEPQIEPEEPASEDLWQRQRPQLVDISPPPALQGVGWALVVPSTIALVSGVFVMAADGYVYGDMLALAGAGAAGLGVSSYILFIRKYPPRISDPLGQGLGGQSRSPVGVGFTFEF